MKVNGYCQLFGYQHSPLFCVPQGKKNTGLEKFKNELIMAEFSFLDELSL